MNKRTLLLLFALMATFSGLIGANINSTPAGGDWSANTTWSGGIVPVAGDDVTIVAGATVIVNQDITIQNLLVQGSLVIGNDLTGRNLTITGTTTVDATGSFTVGAFNITHNVTFQGAVTNNGILDFYNSSSQVANAVFSGIAISGSNIPQFAKVTFNSGTVTAGVAFDINGAVVIENATTFADGGFTHTVAGNWTENGSGQMTGNGTIVMDAQYIQSVTTAATFYNLTFSSGAVGVLGAGITVSNNFLVTNNSDVQSTQSHTFQGDFTVDDGSKYTASDGQATFNSATEQQIVTIGTTNGVPAASFWRAYFDGGNPTFNKLIHGNLYVNSTLYIYDDATLADDANTYTHTFIGDGRIDGVFGISSNVLLRGGTWYDGGADNDFTLGTSEITVKGYVYVGAGDIMRVNKNITIVPDDNGNHTGLIINDNSELIGLGAGDVLTVSNNTSLYIRDDVNFPTTFSTIDLQQGCYVRYDAGLPNQNIYAGVTYWHLYLNAGTTKTALGNLDVNGSIWIYTSTNFLLGTFHHTFAGNIYSSDEVGGRGSMTATGGSVTLDAPDADQSIYLNGTGNYIFNDLYLTSSAPTGARNKYFNDHITVNGNFSATNTGGSVTNMLNVYMYEFVITGDDDFTLGSNVRLLSSGTNTFETSIASFSGVKNFDVASTVRFYRNINGSFQNIPDGFTYGNIELYGNTQKRPMANLDINGNVSNVGGTPVLTDNSHTLNVAGNWAMSFTTTSLTGTNTVIFDGVNQNIGQSNFNHVTFSGSGVKTVSGALDILKNLTIQTGVTVNADLQTINIEGNWAENGTGMFQQPTSGTVIFDGTTANQTVLTTPSSYFYSLTINKTGANKTLTFNSNIDVNGTLNFTENYAALDLNGRNLRVAGDFYFRNGCTFSHSNGTVFFDGNTVAQLIRNYNSSTIVFYDVEFTGTAVKRLYDNSFRFKRNVTITNTTLDGQYWAQYVEGNWINNGVFRHSNTLYFDGSSDQTISQSSFYTVRFQGAGTTKTLTGNITLNGNLYIDDATLDVSPASYAISMDNNWYNNSTGSFIARQGTVTLNGEYSYLFTGESNTQYSGGTFYTTLGGTKAFYNLTITKRTNDYWVLLRGDLHVSNNFVINQGDFRQSNDPVNFGINDITVGGDYFCDGQFRDNYYAETFTLNPASGTHTFTPKSSNTYGVFIFDGAAGSSYTFGSDLNMQNNRAITINNGDISLNRFKLTTNGATGHITMNNGSLTVNENATLSMGAGATFTNAGGTFKLLGASVEPASLIATSGNFTFLQTAGSIQAKFYRIVGTSGNGINISGGSIDATNTFQNGSFSGGTGTAYLTTNGINIGADRTLTDVTFNSGPTFNVQRTSGTGALIFENAIGTLAGESFDNDNASPGTLINWTYPGAKLWTGLGDGTSWNDANNWGPVGIPTSATTVILDHTNVAGVYTVNLNSDADGLAKSLLINSGGSAISLILNGKTLTISGDVTISTSSVLTQTTAADVITVSGSWANQGTFNSGTSTVIFNPATATHTITALGAADPFYNLTINGTDGVNVISSNIYVNNNVLLQDGTLTAGNFTLFVSGSWTRNGGTIFNVGTSTVNFNKAGAQNINGGEFYNFTTSGSGTKTITANVDIDNSVTLNAGTVLDAGTNTIYIGGSWTNLVGNTGFTQTGSGTVFFDGVSGTQTIGAGASLTSTFNHIIFSGNTKTIDKNINVNGNVTLSSGTLYIRNAIDMTGDGVDNSFAMSGGTLYLQGHSADFSNNFPKNFETINLSAGSVVYQANFNQTIYPTTYSTLYVRRENAGNLSTKTMTGNITVNGSLYNDDVETLLDVNDFTIFLYGGIGFATGGRQIDWGTNGTLDHFGEWYTVDADILSFNNVIKRNRGYLNIQYTPITITGNMSILEDAYLRQDAVNITCTGAGKTFTLAPTAYVQSFNPENVSGNKAFPTGFATYDLHADSRVYISGTVGDQEIYTVPTYGNLYINTGAEINIFLDGNLDVNGSFTMTDQPTLIDNGHNINIAGATVDIRKYTPSGATTMTFDGANQSIYDAGPNATVFDMKDVVFAGSGTKNMQYNGDDWYLVTGNLTINPGVTVSIPRRLDFSGSTWLNNGTFSNTAYQVNFIGNTPQSINPGANNMFYAVNFTGTGLKTFTVNGIVVGNGTFTLGAGVGIDMGSLTHRIASERITDNGSTPTTQFANFIFDRNGTQYLPSLTCNDLIFRRYDQWDRIRQLEGQIDVNNLIIEDGTQLRCSQDADVTTPTYDVIVHGNFTNDGYLYAWGNTFYFESPNTDPKTIKQGQGSFDNVMFNHSETFARTYTLLQDTRIYEDLTIGNRATLDVNGQNLYLGNDDSNDPAEPAAEVHTIESGGTLDVDAGASLIFSCRDLGNTQLNVDGTLKILGVNGNNATVTSNDWHSNNMRIDINIKSGATIHARYYLMKYLSNEGFFVDAGATLDAVNNFSDGTWSDLNTSTAATYNYLYCNADATGLNPIDNVIFNFGGNPTVGKHFNIQRDATSTGVINLGSACGGLLTGSRYEADPTGENLTASSKIDWAPISDINWTGNVSTDWFNPNNWSPATVPTNTNNAIIPIRANNPIIFGQHAVCKDLKITDGFLTLQADWNLSIGADAYIGTGTSVGILAVEASTSTITVNANWTRGQNGLFIHGDGTVIFGASGGSVSIDPRSSAFGNVTFNGDATFMLNRYEIFTDGDFTISNGVVQPIVNNYLLHIKGDYNNISGTFDNTILGTIYLDGAGDQSITKADFWTVIVDGAGNKTVNTSCKFNGNLTVKHATLVAGCAIDFNNYVQIDAPAGFNDGGFTHNFIGYRWTGLGAYTGTGTIEFERDGYQEIAASKFSNVLLQNNSGVTMSGNVDMTGNMTLIAPNTSLNLQTYSLTNTSGTGTLSVADSRYLYVRGANNFPTGFANYALHRNSYTMYDGTMPQTIAPVPVTYGRLYLDNSTKTAGGHLDINGFLYIYDDVTFDITANNYRINLESHWYNQSGATFIPHQGEVIFDGNDATSYIFVYEPSKLSNPFYKLTVNKGAGQVYTSYTDLTVQNNLRVINGIFSNGRTVYVGGDMSALSGKFATNGTYYLNKTSGTSNLQFNGSTIYNLTINSPASYFLQDDLKMNGIFNLIAGTFDGGGHLVRMGDYGEVHDISGLYKIGAGGILQLADYSTFKVNSGGEIWVVGEAANVASVTNYSGRYYFNVENGGTIRARNYLFEYMAENGIYIKNGSTIHPDYNFSYGTFTNSANGGACLRIENNQSFTEAGGNPIVEVSFPFNSGGGSANVVKISAAAGTLDFKDYYGEFAGEDFDNDPTSLVNWISPPYVMWTGNIDNDWYKIGNWQVTSGPARIPLITDNVVITKRTNQPVINTDGAVAKTLDVQTNAVLTLASAAVTATTLTVDDDVTFTGMIVMTDANNSFSTGGNWYNLGLFTAGQGTVTMNSVFGIKALNNRSDAFYNLHINTVSEIQLAQNLTVNKNFILYNGMFDLTADNRIMTVKGDFLNYGNFVTRAAKLVFAGTSGAQTFDPGTSSFYNIDINASAGTTVSLAVNPLRLTHNLNVNSGTFTLNGLDFYMGDASGTDVLTITGGTFIVNANAHLRPANNSSVEVNSGGTIKLVGTNVDNPAYVIAQSGSYAFSVYSGATIHMRYYDVQNLNANGIRVKSGAIIDATNNFSYGTWRNGATAGQYLWLENNFADFTVKGTYFHNGAGANVKRLSGSGVISFEDALGLKAGHLYEIDSPANGAATGLVRWTFTHPVYVWTGNVNTDWNIAGNWDGPGVGDHFVPNALGIARIPDVTATTGNKPILGINSADADGTCYDLIIEPIGHVTINNGKNLDVDNSVTVMTNGKLTVAPGSASRINVADIWSIDGRFEHGYSSTVVFDAPAGKLLTIAGTTSFYNLEINSTGNAEYISGSSIRCDGSFGVTHGVFTVSNPTDTLYVKGHFTNSGTFTHGNAIVVLNGAVNQTVNFTGGIGDLYRLQSKGSQNKILASNLTIWNDLEIFAGSTLNGGANTLSLYGDWVNRGTFNSATSTIQLLGSSTQLIDNYNAETFYNLVVNNTSLTFPQIVLYGDVSLTGTNWTMTDGILETTADEMLTVGQNIVLTGGNSTASYVNGPITKLGLSNFTFPTGDGAKFARIKISGMSSTGTFVAEYHEAPYSDVSSLGAGLDHVSGYEHWTLNRTAGTAQPTVTFFWEDGAQSGIDNPATLTTAVYTAVQWKNTGNGGTTGTVAVGSITSGIPFTEFGPCGFAATNNTENPLHGYTSWTGSMSTVWNNPNNWTMGVPTTLMDATIPAAPLNQPVIDVDAQVRKLIIYEGASLTVNPLKSLTTYGKLYIKGTFLLKSGISGNASLINLNTISYGANCSVTTQLYLTGGKYHHLASPTTQTHTDVFKRDPYLPYFNPNFYNYTESGSTWDQVPADWNEFDGNMIPMNGYTYYGDRNITALIERGAVGNNFNTGDFSKTLYYTAGTEPEVIHRGWNFIGNPYPANLDWTNAAWTKTNIYNSIYFWNGVNYSYFVAGDAAQNNGLGVNDGTSIIPPMQGYFVKVKENATPDVNQTGTLVTPQAARTTATHAFWKSANEKGGRNADVVRLTIGSNGHSDETAVRFLPTSTASFDDNYDAFKLLPSDWYGVPQIYSFAGEVKCAINTLPQITHSLYIPVGFHAPVSGNFTITAADFNLNSEETAYFEDKYTHEIFELQNLSYTFSSESGSFNDRFGIKFRNTPSSLDDANRSETPEVRIFAENQILKFYSETGDAVVGSIQVYNSVGQVVMQFDNAREGYFEKTVTLAEGMYIVKLQTRYGTETQKVNIRK